MCGCYNWRNPANCWQPVDLHTLPGGKAREERRASGKGPLLSPPCPLSDTVVQVQVCVRVRVHGSQLSVAYQSPICAVWLHIHSTASSARLSAELTCICSSASVGIRIWVCVCLAICNLRRGSQPASQRASERGRSWNKNEGILRIVVIIVIIIPSKWIISEI